MQPPPSAPGPPQPGPPPWQSPLLDPYIPPARQDPVWPVVLGVVALALAAYGVLMHLVAFQSHKILTIMTANAAAPGVAAALEELKGITRINSALCLLLSLPLMAGGIALLRRRKIARRLLLTWAGLRIVLAIGVAPFTLHATRAFAGALPPGSLPAAAAAPPATVPGTTPSPAPGLTSPPGAPTGPPTGGKTGPPRAASMFTPADFMGTFQVVGAVTGVLGACAFPLATILWLNRRRTLASLAEWQGDSR